MNINKKYTYYAAYIADIIHKTNSSLDGHKPNLSVICVDKVLKQKKCENVLEGE